MAKCANCGAELIEGARFCRECGAKIEAPAVTVEKVAAVKSEIETTAVSLRELTDKMLATYVAGMKDLEDAVAKAKAEAVSKAAEYEAKLRDSSVILEAKTRELNELTEKYNKLQMINQQLQTDKFDAQSAVAELNNKVAALEQARSSLVAALNAQQAAAAVSAPAQSVAAVQQPSEAAPIPDSAQPASAEEEA